MRETEEQKAIWRRLITGPRSEDALRTVMWRVACSLSNMVGRTISNGDPRVEAVPLSQVAVRAGNPGTEMVGVYLVVNGGLRGQAILILPLTSALNLADLLMGQPQGTTTYLGEMEQSALAEIGNVVVSSFLNAVATHTGAEKLLRPSSPAVMVNMLDAILDVIVTPVAAVRDDLLIIETARVFGISRGEGLDAPTCWGCDAANPNKFGLPSHLPREIPESQQLSRMPKTAYRLISGCCPIRQFKWTSIDGEDR